MSKINGLITAAVLSSAMAVAVMSPAAANAAYLVPGADHYDVNFTLCHQLNDVFVKALNDEYLDYQIWYDGVQIYNSEGQSVLTTTITQGDGCRGFTLRVINNDDYQKKFKFRV